MWISDFIAKRIDGDDFKIEMSIRYLNSRISPEEIASEIKSSLIEKISDDLKYDLVNEYRESLSKELAAEIDLAQIKKDAMDEFREQITSKISKALSSECDVV